MPKRNLDTFILLGSQNGSGSPPPELAVVEEQAETVITANSPTTPALDETNSIYDDGDDPITYHLLGENSVQTNNGHDDSAVEEVVEVAEETTLDDNNAKSNSEFSVFSLEDLELDNAYHNGNDQQQLFVDVKELEEPGVNVTIHGKESTEQDLGEEEEEEETVITTPSSTTTTTTFASTPPPTPTITSDTLVSNFHTSITTVTTVSHTQSDRLTPLDLNRLKALDPPDPESQHLGTIHQKSSLEQNGFNDPDNPPFRWVPPPVEEEDTLLAPRFPDDGTDEAGKIYCKSSDGSFGAKKGGVILRYQYEVTVDTSNGDDLNSDIVPSLESGITDTLLPVFFGEECLEFLGTERVGTVVVRMGPIFMRRTRRNLRGSEEEEEGVLRQQQQQQQDQLQHHRRLSKVVGIDSKPPDFALKKDCSMEDLSLSSNTQCHTMEGSLTIYFPPNYSISTYIQGVHLEMLLAIKEDMTDGSLAERAHPAIRSLSFSEDSYSLTPVLPSDVDDGDVDGKNNEGDNAGFNIIGLVVGIMIPLLLCCCCGCCFVGWKRRGGNFKDLFLPKRSSSLVASSAVESEDEEEDDSPREEANTKKKKKKKKKEKIKKSGVKRSKKRSSSQGSIESEESDDEDHEEGSQMDSTVVDLSSDIERMRSSQRTSVRKKGDARGSSSRGSSRSSQNSGMQSSRGSSRSSQNSAMHSSPDNSVMSGSEQGSQTSSSAHDSQTSSGKRDASHARSGIGRGNSPLIGIDEGEDEDNGTTTSSDSTDDNSTTSSGSGSDDSSTTSSDRGSTTEGSTTTSSRGRTTDDNDSTTTSTDTSDDESTTSSDDEEAATGDQFDLGPGFHADFRNQRKGVRQRRASARQQRARGGGRRQQHGAGNNSNLVMTGKVDDDNLSVMTGMTGATGVHSLSSMATTQVGNMRGGAGDDVSVMTGASRTSGTTERVSLSSMSTAQVGNMGRGAGDDVSVMTGVSRMSGATEKVSNIAGVVMPKLSSYGVRNASDEAPGGGSGPTFTDV